MVVRPGFGPDRDTVVSALESARAKVILRLKPHQT